MPASKRLIALMGLILGLGGVAYGAEGGLRVTGPYTHLNLEVYLIHGPQTVSSQRYLTLGEALAAKQVVVHETGSVQELAIQNLGRLPVFIQSGDIVKGGRQDRVLRSDMIVPPRSGRVPLASFCVESGRWTKRGREDAGKFASNSAMVSSRELKLAAKHVQNQSAVWSSVAKQQKQLNASLRRMKGDQDLDVRSGASATSLQLTLENKELKEMAAEYKRELAGLLEDRRGAIGFALVVNGQVSAADIYGRRDLFQALWPKLLDAAVVEAISEYTGEERAGALGEAARRIKTLEAVSSLLATGQSEVAESRDPSARTRVVVRERGDLIVFETRDRALADAVVHRNFLKKVPMPVRPQPQVPINNESIPNQVQQRVQPLRGLGTQQKQRQDTHDDASADPSR